MSKRLFRWLGFLSKHRPEPSPQNLNQEDGRYPAFSKGIAVEPIERIVDRQRELIQQIVQSRGLAGLHNRRKAEEQIISPIKHFAEWVHLLPASDNSYFKGEGGLFRFGLESALFSIRHAERSILTRVTPEERREAERIWTHAAFLAGLVSESVLTLSKMNVYSENGDTWHPGVEPLYQWLMCNRVKNYYIRWLATVDSAMATAIAAKTIQQEQAALLAKGEKSVLPTLMSAIQNPYDGSNQIVAIVRTIRLKLIDKDLAEDPTNYGKPLSGMHLEPWLIDAMRHMIVNRHWLANTETGRIWYGLDGLYLVWPLAAADIKEELRNAKCPFVPKTTEIIAEMMCEAGIIDQNEAVGGYIFTIGIPQASSKLKPLSAIRIKRKEILLLDEAFTPIGIQLLFNGNVADVQDVSIGVSDDDTEVERVAHANTDLVDFGVASENTEYDADYASQYEDGYPVQSNSDDDKDKILAGKSVQSLDTFGGILNGSIVEENVT
jgi:conjugal transfer pilus assembly protein TraI